MEGYGRMPPTIYRVRSSTNKVQLPKDVVVNIGSNSELITHDGAVVHWYYYEDAKRAVLSSNSAENDNEFLQKIHMGSISGVSNNEIFEKAPIIDKNKIDKVESGQITIPKDLPNETYERLIKNDEIVLQFLYPDTVDFVNNIWLVLIPAKLFDIYCYKSIKEVF
jgi:hypothetical protein